MTNHRWPLTNFRQQSYRKWLYNNTYFIITQMHTKSYIWKMTGDLSGQLITLKSVTYMIPEKFASRHNEEDLSSELPPHSTQQWQETHPQPLSYKPYPFSSFFSYGERHEEITVKKQHENSKQHDYFELLLKEFWLIRNSILLMETLQFT